MKNIRFCAITALLVLVPPIWGSIAYFAPFRNGFDYFADNYFYIASASIVWWPFSLCLKKRIFFAGLLGMHAMMSWFLYSMWGRGNDLGWILYLPALLVGCLVAVIISEIARKLDQWIHRILQ